MNYPIGVEEILVLVIEDDIFTFLLKLCWVSFWEENNDEEEIIF